MSEQSSQRDVGDVKPFVTCDFPIAVCWSPKAGCTTVLKWFLFHTGLFNQAYRLSDWPHDYRERDLYHRPGYAELCVQSLVQKQKFVIKVIRDPARRAVSSFLHLLRHLAPAGSDKHWRAMLSWKKSLGLGRQEGLSFDQLLRYVVACGGRGKHFDGHLRAQWQPLQDPYVDVYIPLERLNPELRKLEQQFGLAESPLDHFSLSAHHNPPSLDARWPADAARCPVTSGCLAALGTPRAEVFLDAGTRALLHAAYAQDYAAYGQFYPACE